MNSFDKYLGMKERCATPLEVCLVAKRDKVDSIRMTGLLRGVFDLTFVQVKDVLAKSNGYQSLDEQHEELAEIAEQLEHDKIRGVA